MALREEEIRNILKEGNELIFLDEAPSIDPVKSYDEKAPIYEKIRKSDIEKCKSIDANFKEYIRKYITSNGILLDVGTGDGLRIKGYEDLALQIKAMDISQEMVNFAKRNGIDAILGDYNNIEENSYNVITSLHSVINIGTEEQIIQRFKQVYDGLKEDGLFCFDVIDADSDKRFIAYFNTDSNQIPYKNNNGLEIVSWSRLLSQDEIRKYAKSVGFKEVQIDKRNDSHYCNHLFNDILVILQK